MSLGTLLVAAAVAVPHVVHVDGAPRRYRLHVPANAGDAALPVVVAFHAAGATAARQERASRLSALADRARFVVVYAEGRERRWEGDAADEAYVRAVIADVARRTRVDARRVYAAGVSNGAVMAQRAACRMNDVFAAVATVAGTYRPDDACVPRVPVPVLAIHGARDTLAPIAGAESWVAGWSARNECAPRPALAESAGVATRTWGGCTAGARVVFHVLRSAGHGWPGDPSDRAQRGAALDASAAIWAFFADHARRPAA